MVSCEDHCRTPTLFRVVVVAKCNAAVIGDFSMRFGALAMGKLFIPMCKYSGKTQMLRAVWYRARYFVIGEL